MPFYQLRVDSADRDRSATVVTSRDWSCLVGRSRASSAIFFSRIFWGQGRPSAADRDWSGFVGINLITADRPAVKMLQSEKMILKWRPGEGLLCIATFFVLRWTLTFLSLFRGWWWGPSVAVHSHQTCFENAFLEKYVHKHIYFQILWLCMK